MSTEWGAAHDKPRLPDLIDDGRVTFIADDVWLVAQDPRFTTRMTAMIDGALGEKKAVYLNAYGNDVELGCVEPGNKGKFLSLINWTTRSILVDVGLRMAAGVEYEVLSNSRTTSGRQAHTCVALLAASRWRASVPTKRAGWLLKLALATEPREMQSSWLVMAAPEQHTEKTPKSAGDRPSGSPFPCDVLVAGGGMAGVMAALAARVGGHRVVLIEPHNVLGGQGTAGGVAGFCGDTARVNTPFREWVERLLGYGRIVAYNPISDRRGYDLEWFAFVLQEAVEAAGVDILLDASVVGARAVQGRVTEVDVAACGRVLRATPRFVIDATGLCAVAKAAGFAVQHEGALRQLPMSLYFTLWDTGKPVEPLLPEGCPQWEGEADLPMTSLHRFPSGKVEVKMKVIGFDAADPHSLSEAERYARRQMFGLVYHLQTRGYAGARLDRHVLAGVSRQIGIREQCRIVGEHVLSEDEVTHGCVFDDAVAVGTYHLDYHWPDRAERAGTGVCTMVEPYHIPLRALIPRGARNLLVPGRGASGDQMAMSSFRVMAPVAQMGLAAGAAARTCLETGHDLSDLDVPRLRAAIEAEGQSLNLSDYGEYLRDRIVTHEPCFGDDRPFTQCHASTLAQLEDNRFFVAWFGGTHEKHPDVGIWCTDRFRGRWSAPRLLAKVSDEAHWNPVLLYVAPDGSSVSARELHLWFKVGDTIEEWRTWHTVSRDQGATWDEPVAVQPDETLPLGPVKNKPIVLSDGSWLTGFSDERGAGEDRAWDAYAGRSTDGGRTWTDIARVPLDRATVPGVGVIQPTLWESEPGCVHMLLRSGCGRVCRSDSRDYGRTWTAVRPTDVPNNNSGLDAARLADGTVALVCNPVGGDFGPRTPLSILLSSDNGETWPRRLDLETGEGEFSYPSIIPTPVGMAVSYTWKRERIVFWQGSVEQAK